MRKTITGTGGMLLVQTLKDAGVEYLFTNPGSAETGIFAALAEEHQDWQMKSGARGRVSHSDIGAGVNGGGDRM